MINSNRWAFSAWCNQSRSCFFCIKCFIDLLSNWNILWSYLNQCLSFLFFIVLYINVSSNIYFVLKYQITELLDSFQGPFFCNQLFFLSYSLSRARFFSLPSTLVFFLCVWYYKICRLDFLFFFFLWVSFFCFWFLLSGFFSSSLSLSLFLLRFFLYSNATITPSSQFFAFLLIKTLWYVMVAFFALLLRSSVERHKQKKTKCVRAQRLVVVAAVVECTLLSVAEHRTQGTREVASSMLAMM